MPPPPPASPPLIAPRGACGATANAFALLDLSRPEAMDRICQLGCSWPHDLEWTFFVRYGVGHAEDKPLFCMKSFEGAYCRLEIESTPAWGNEPPGNPGRATCALLANGCAAYLRELRVASDARACAQSSMATLNCTHEAMDAFDRDFVAPCEERYPTKPLLPPTNFVPLRALAADARIIRVALDSTTGHTSSAADSADIVLVEPSEPARKGAVLMSGFTQSFDADETAIVRHGRELASLGYVVFGANTTMKDSAGHLLFRGFYQFLGRELKLPASRTVHVKFWQAKGERRRLDLAGNNATWVEITVSSAWGVAAVKPYEASCTAIETCSEMVINVLRTFPDAPVPRSHQDTAIQAFLRDLFSWTRLSTGILVSAFALAVRLLIAIWRSMRACYKWLSKPGRCPAHLARWIEGACRCKRLRAVGESVPSRSATHSRPGLRGTSRCAIWRWCCWCCRCFRCCKRDDSAGRKTCLVRLSMILVKYPKRCMYTVLAILIIPSVGALVMSLVRGTFNIDLVSEASFKITAGKVRGAERLHTCENTRSLLLTTARMFALLLWQFAPRLDAWSLLSVAGPTREAAGSRQPYACRGPHGEACRPGWVNVRHHLGRRLLNVHEDFDCDRTGLVRNTPCERPIRPYYYSLSEALLVCESLPTTCTGVQFDAINRYNLWQERTLATDAISLGDREMGYRYMPSSRRLESANELPTNPGMLVRDPSDSSADILAGHRRVQSASESQNEEKLTPATIKSGIEISYTRARTWRAMQQGGDMNILAPEAVMRIQAVEQQLRELQDFGRFSTSFSSLVPCFHPNSTTPGGLLIDSSCDLSGQAMASLFGSDLSFSYPNMSCSALKTRISFEYPLTGPGSFVGAVVRYLEQSSDDIISVAFDGGSFKNTAIWTTVIDDVFLIVPSIAGVFVICATVLLRLKFAVAALLMVLLALPVSPPSS
jgi:hypothetical protein